MVSDLKKNISIFFQMLEIRRHHVISIYTQIKIYSKWPAVIIIVENECLNSSKSFSVRSLRLPRGTLGVVRSSSSIVAELEDVCSCILVSIIYYNTNKYIYIVTTSSSYFSCIFSRNAAIAALIVASVSASFTEFNGNV